MGTYKGIQGYRVESLASDPGDITKVIGKVWYNSSSNVWKVGVEAPGSWSAAPTLNEARSSAGYSGTSNTSAMIFGGNEDYPFALPGKTEQYNGTSWTEKANLSQALNNNAAAGGPATPTAALCMGGNPEPQGQTTRIWDGSSWTDSASLNAVVASGMGCGTSPAALCIGGSPTPRANETEIWNGTSWTVTADSGNNRTSGGASGTSTAALQFGGYDSNLSPPTNTVNVEKWNGTSWTEVANLGQSATTTGGCSISSSATMKIGGYSGPPEIYYNFTEEWQDPVIGAKTITTS